MSIALFCCGHCMKSIKWVWCIVLSTMAHQCSSCSVWMDKDAEFDDGMTRYTCPNCGATAHDSGW